MDAVAKFVFASGGVVSVAELNAFFSEQPLVESAFYAAASPVRQLKKIVRHFGSPYGLSWSDSDSMITHTLTERQQQWTESVELWIPRCLDALETLLRGAAGKRLKSGEFARLHSQLSAEVAFMRRRSGGNVLRFVAEYDPECQRFGTSDTELWLVEEHHTHQSHGEETPLGTQVSSSPQFSSVHDNEEEQKEEEGQQDDCVTPTLAVVPDLPDLPALPAPAAPRESISSPIGPRAAVATRPSRVLSWDDCTFALPYQSSSSSTTTCSLTIVSPATPEATSVAAADPVALIVQIGTGAPSLPPPTRHSALQALRVVACVFIHQQVVRSPFAMSASELLAHVCRLVIQRQTMRINPTTTTTTTARRLPPSPSAVLVVSSLVLPLRPASPPQPSSLLPPLVLMTPSLLEGPAQCAKPHPAAQGVGRFLVPNASTGIEWRVAA